MARSLISTDALDAVLSGYSSELQRQSTVIAELQRQLSVLQTSNAATTAVEKCNERISAFERRLDLLESRVAIPATPTNPSPGPIGMFTADLGARLERMEAQVLGEADGLLPSHSTSASSNEIIRRSALTAALEALSERQTSSFATALDGCASRSALSRVTETQDALSTTLGALEGQLCSKADRSDLLRLQATAADLNSFAGWKAAASADIRELYGRSDESRAGLKSSVDKLAHLSQLLQALADSNAKKAESAALQVAQTGLSSLAAALESCAQTKDLVALSASIDKVNGKLSEMNAAHAALQGAHARGLVDGSTQVKAVSEAASKDLSGLSASVAKSLAELRAEMDTKAYLTAVEATDESIGAATSAISTLNARVDICLRFIEWFSEKGEAYEYNAAALERHMNSLAVENRAKTTGAMSSTASSKGFRGLPADLASFVSTGSIGVRLGGTTTSA